AAGVWRPVLYFSASRWPEISASLHSVGISRSDVRIWSAHYTGHAHFCSASTCGFAIAGGSDATPWGSSDHKGMLPALYAGRTLDVSVPSDHFFGKAPAPPPFKALIGLGHSGHDVTVWQRRMAQRGWRITVTGTFDAQSQAICKKFQKEKGLHVTGQID